MFAIIVAAFSGIEKAAFFTKMSGLGRYPLNIPSLSDAFLGSSDRRDRLDYDDRRFRDRDRDRRDDDFRRDGGGSRGRTSRDRFSPEVSLAMSCENERISCLKRVTLI